VRLRACNALLATAVPRIVYCVWRAHAFALIATQTTNSLLAGESGISLIDRFDASEYPTRFGGQIKNFDDEGCVFFLSGCVVSVCVVRARCGGFLACRAVL
jgi:hypothetical protein